MINAELAFVFPGQGSQTVGMMMDLANRFPVVIETFEQASVALGYDVIELVQQGPAAKLNQTQFAQPALLAAGYAAWRIWGQLTAERPAVMAGHSLGEFTALVCAGAITFEDGLQLVADRGKYMQDAVPNGAGAMAAIVGLDEEKVVALCHQIAIGQVVSAANYNAIGQTVISGTKQAVEAVIKLAIQAGAKLAKILPVSVPSHCQLMQPAAERFAARLVEVKLLRPAIPVIHNVDVKMHDNVEAIKAALVKQLCSPVRWVETIQAMANQGVKQIIECGPGQVLTGLTKRISRTLNAIPIATSCVLVEKENN